MRVGNIPVNFCELMNGSKRCQTNRHQRVFPKAIFCLVCFASLFFAGCIKYQYITVDSYLNKNENKEFVEENDTVMMKYNFAGTDFPISITVFNKLQQPLYLDFGKSKVIMNDVPIDDAFDREGQADSIAPQSYATIRSNNLSDKFISLSSQDKKTNVVVPTSDGNRNVKLHIFSQETSPVYFRSVLALSTQVNSSLPVLYDRSFWVSGIFQALDLTPSNLPSDQFYMQKTTDFVKGITYTGAAILILSLAAVTPQEE